MQFALELTKTIVVHIDAADENEAKELANLKDAQAEFVSEWFDAEPKVVMLTEGVVL